MSLMSDLPQSSRSEANPALVEFMRICARRGRTVRLARDTPAQSPVLEPKKQDPSHSGPPNAARTRQKETP